MGSDVYTVPPEHRYRIFLDEGDSHVDCVAQGIRSLMELCADLQLKSQYAPKHALSPYEKKHFLEAEACTFCGHKDELVREHCHFTGAYRGAACKSCNARLALRRLPCLAHNFSGFDSGPVIRALAELRGECDYDITPLNRSSEKMIYLLHLWPTTVPRLPLHPQRQPR